MPNVGGSSGRQALQRVPLGVAARKSRRRGERRCCRCSEARAPPRSSGRPLCLVHVLAGSAGRWSPRDRALCCSRGIVSVSQLAPTGRSDLLRSGSQLGRCRDSRVDLSRGLQFVLVRAWGPSLRLWSSRREGEALRPRPTAAPVARHSTAPASGPRQDAASVWIQGLSRAGACAARTTSCWNLQDEPLVIDGASVSLATVVATARG